MVTGRKIRRERVWESEWTIENVDMCDVCVYELGTVRFYRSSKGLPNWAVLDSETLLVLWTLQGQPVWGQRHFRDSQCGDILFWKTELLDTRILASSPPNLVSDANWNSTATGDKDLWSPRIQTSRLQISVSHRAHPPPHRLAAVP